MFKGRKVLAWGGPFRGTQLIAGEDWHPYQAASFVTPPFPEYTSGHSGFSTASAEILKLFTGSDKFGASVTLPVGSSRIEPGLVPSTPVTLEWKTFTEAAEEASLSRLYGGIHFNDGNEQGRIMGRKDRCRGLEESASLLSRELRCRDKQAKSLNSVPLAWSSSFSLLCCILGSSRERNPRIRLIQKIRAADRFHIESDWLSAYWLFSFDRYYDPENVSFGPLRVFNHDTVQPAAGFPTHSHREMEIVTYVLEGELTHKDSTGGRGVIRSSEVQRMTAGTGVAHSELNASVDQPVKLLQMWVLPSEPELTPSYEQRRFSTAGSHREYYFRLRRASRKVTPSIFTRTRLSMCHASRKDTRSAMNSQQRVVPLST